MSSQRSLRAASTALGLPIHRLSADEIDASVVNFAWLERVNGMSSEEVAEAVRNIRAAQRHKHNRQENPESLRTSGRDKGDL
jgi:hypothetical protein